MKLRVDGHVMSHNKARISGKVRPGGRRWVDVRVGGKKVKTVRTRKSGTFRIRWNPPHPGVYKAKAVVRGNEHAKRAGSKTRRINAYRSSHASYVKRCPSISRPHQSASTRLLHRRRPRQWLREDPEPAVDAGHRLRARRCGDARARTR